MTQTAATEVEMMRGRVRELGHIVLYVSDLDRSLAFYRDILGWPVIWPPGQYPVAGFRAGNTHHDLLLIEVGPDAKPMPEGRRLGLYHFGVNVGDSDDDLRALLARLEARPDLARVVGAVDEGFAHSLYVEDPDGNEVELMSTCPARTGPTPRSSSTPRAFRFGSDRPSPAARPIRRDPCRCAQSAVWALSRLPVLAKM